MGNTRLVQPVEPTDGIFRVRQRGQNVSEGHGFRAASAKRVLLDQLLAGADVFPATVFLAIGRALD